MDLYGVICLEQRNRAKGMERTYRSKNRSENMRVYASEKYASEKYASEKYASKKYASEKNMPVKKICQ